MTELSGGTLDGLLDQARAELIADTAAVLLFDQSEQFLVATAAKGIEDEVRQGARVKAGLGFAGRVASERRPVILDRIGPHNVSNPLLLKAGIVSMLGVPLLGRDRVLGVLHVGTLAPRAFTAADVAALEGLGRQIAAAILRHRSFVDMTAAQALQNSLTPRLPDLPGIELAARYVPGSEYGVGGDWYDVFPVPDGHIGITIGDVMGHGLRAAVVMGRVRSALRAYALEDDSPASVLGRLDRKMQHFEPAFIGTVLYGLLDPTTGGLVFSTAGHLPPALWVPGSPAELLPLPADPPIGVTARSGRRDTTALMPVGAMLCLFTDGLVEQRFGVLDDRLAQLTATLCSPAVASAGSPAEAACAELMTVMAGGREAFDDISLLVVARTP